MKNIQHLKVIKESPSGMNMRFRDDLTGKELSRTEVAKGIDQGIYPDYIYYRNQNGRLVIRSKSDGNVDNNLG